MYKQELKRLFASPYFLSVLLIVNFYAIKDFYTVVTHYIGVPIYMNCVTEERFLIGLSGQGFRDFIFLMFPFLAIFVYSLDFHQLHEGNYFSYVKTRIEFKKYLKMKNIYSFIAGFLIFFIPLFVNLLLCNIAFPNQGYDSHFFHPYSRLQYFVEYPSFLSSLQMNYPNLHYLIIIMILSIFGGYLSYIGTKIASIKEIKLLPLLFSIGILYYLINTILEMNDKQNLIFNNVFYDRSTTSLQEFILMIIIYGFSYLGLYLVLNFKMKRR